MSTAAAAIRFPRITEETLGELMDQGFELRIRDSFLREQPAMHAFAQRNTETLREEALMFAGMATLYELLKRQMAKGE